MNNQQFRRLLFDNTDDKDGVSSDAGAGNGATPSTLGARKAGFMPMTPRTVTGGTRGGELDFARQVREQHATLRPTKKFKSSAPKGVKYGAGYTDRAKARADGGDAGDQDDKANRVKALEEQMKLGQISENTFEALRDEITGGDIGSTHLIKGLDRKLLERIRRGEDVLGTREEKADEDAPPDVDEELDRLGEKEVETVKKVAAETKKGTMASPATLAGTKRTRDEIMAELKAQRRAAAEAKAAPLLDGRWKKVGEVAKPRIEIDRKGREVLVTVDQDGVVKKKVRRAAPQKEKQEPLELRKPESSHILGSDVVVPQAPKTEYVAPESEDDDIFAGVGTSYDPLGDEDDDVSSDEDGKGKDSDRPADSDIPPPKGTGEDDSERQSTAKAPAPAVRNYFKHTQKEAESEDGGESEEARLAGVQQLLKKAAKMDSTSMASQVDGDGESREADAARLKKHAQMLSQQDRDLDDMDMGFGSSRYDDGDEEADGKVKLSEWKGEGEHHEDGEKGGGKKSKRKPKKRKGDANNMADIMRVIDGRKSEGK